MTDMDIKIRNKADVQKVKEMVELLLEQRSSSALEGYEGDNRIIDRGMESLVRLEKRSNEISEA